MKRLLRSVAPAMLANQARFLNVHEYQAKQLLQDAGCATELGFPAKTIEEVEAALAKIKSTKKVVKSQILAGGRGMGTFVDGYKGGVKVVADNAEALAVAKRMLGNTLVTKQTGPNGQKVQTLFITEAITNIKREMYLALVLDRKTCSPTFIGSAEGGMHIEELAHTNPEKIKKLAVNIHEGLDREAAIRYAKDLGFDDIGAEHAADQLSGMYNLAKAKDCTMVEVNPLVELENGEVMCIDAKLSFDDNASFRRPEVWALADTTQMDPKEVLAQQADLNYVALDGEVGCLVNGAGLAMATMDLIALNGMKPANFLDVGGSATASQIVKAFQIITMDKHVKCILVNIFGVIMKCDTIATGVIEAIKAMGEKLTVPIVVRLEGTNDKLGKKLLDESGLKLFTAEGLDEAGRVACDVARKHIAGQAQ